MSKRIFKMVRTYSCNDPRIKGVIERLKERNIDYYTQGSTWLKDPVTIYVNFNTHKQRKFLEHLNFR